MWAELIGGARYCQDQLAAIVARTRPDVIVEDNVISFPALLTAGVPFVRIVSCNPLEIADPGLPPAFSGYPVADQSGGPTMGRVPGRVRPGAPGGVGGVQRLGHRARARRHCPTWSSSTPGT